MDMRQAQLFYNARIYTQDINHPQADSVLIAGKKIVAVGKEAEIRQRVQGGNWGSVEARDLAGATVLPGFCESHIHLLAFARSLEQIDLEGLSSKEEVVRTVAEASMTHPPGEWLVGRGWNVNEWKERTAPPRKEDLDAVLSDIPVVLLSKDMHTLWANSAALEALGVNGNALDLADEWVERDPDTGEPTGILREGAIRLLEEKVPQPSLAAHVRSLRRAQAVLHQLGITAVHVPEGSDVVTALQQMDEAGELVLRVTIYPPVSYLPHLVRLGLTAGFGSERLKLGGVKIFVDGALGSQTAAMFEPYEGRQDYCGLLVTDYDTLYEQIKEANTHGWPVAIHAIGDRANALALRALAAARQDGSSGRFAKGRREGVLLRGHNRIEHAQIIRPCDLPLFSQAGAVASVQPTHLASDRYTAEREWGARSRYAYPFRSLLQSGVSLAFGSDCPVENPNPMLGLYAAVCRRRVTEPDSEPWYPEQCLTIEEAVRAYTYGGAYASGDVGRWGQIIPGAEADLVLLDRDILRCSPEDIPAARVLATIVGGKVVYGGL